MGLYTILVKWGWGPLTLTGSEWGCANYFSKNEGGAAYSDGGGHLLDNKNDDWRRRGGGGGYFFVKPSVYKNDWRGWGGDGERHHVAERLVGATSTTIKMMIGGGGGGYLFVKPSV